MQDRRADLLLFDLGGVLIEYRGFQALQALLGASMTEAELRAHSAEMDFWPDFEVGKLTPEEFGQRFTAHWRLPHATDRFLDEFESWTPGLLPGASDLLDELRSRFRLAALSNTNAVHWRRIESVMGVPRLFERAFASHKLGLRKPDAAVYERVLLELDIEPQRVTFFDDVEVNVEAARRAGINAYQVEGVPALRARLQELGYL
jgi:putative hydrolase of the HAD superfamily